MLVYLPVEHSVMMQNIYYLFYYHLVLEYSEPLGAEYQQYNVQTSSKKRRNVTNCQDLVIYRAVCIQHTRDIQRRRTKN